MSDPPFTRRGLRLYAGCHIAIFAYASIVIAVEWVEHGFDMWMAGAALSCLAGFAAIRQAFHHTRNDRYGPR